MGLLRFRLPFFSNPSKTLKSINNKMKDERHAKVSPDSTCALDHMFCVIPAQKKETSSLISARLFLVSVA